MNNRKRYQPPRYGDRILRWFCAEEVIETLQGDLHELYYKTRKEKGKLLADLQYLVDVLSAFRPFALKRRSGSINSNFTTMYRNYLKIAGRNLIKYKMYSMIKIGGFAIGIAACLMISLFVKHELSYDKHHANKDRIYRVINVMDIPSDPGKGTAFPAQIAQVLKDHFPEIEKAGRLIPYDWYYAGDNQFRPESHVRNNYEKGFAYADQELLEILEIPMIYGDLKHALTEPNSIVLSKKKADKYFPNEDPVGQTIILNEDESHPFVIGGVMEDFPANSHLQFDFFITLTDVEFWQGEQTNWCCWNYNPYILVRPDVDPLDLEEKLLLIRDDYIVAHLRKTGNQFADDAQKYNSFYLQPVKDVRLYSEGIHDIIPHGDIRIVWLFAAIATFILLLACINFVNLSTAKSANRAKEVGLRKVAGSFRGHLIQQFLTESIFFSAISVVLGALLTWILLPYFNAISGKSLVFPWSEWWVAPILAGIIVLIGIIAGIYPSFYLSAFNPIDVIKGNLSHGSKSSKLRGAMVIFQFTTSIILIVGAFIVYRQMSFILNKKLGFDKEQVVLIHGTNTLGDKLKPFKNGLLQLSEVQNTAASNYFPVSGTKRDQNEFWKEGRNKLDKGVGAQIWWVDQDYINTLGMKLSEGRLFSEEIASDSSAIIINQTMARKLGLDSPVGERIMNWRTWTVVGVVEDFHFESMKGDLIGSLGLVRGTHGSFISVKVNTQNIASALESITKVWDEFMPNQPIRYTFLDETYARMYEDVKRTGNLFTSFAVLAIFVACLGLFGLSAFMAEQRRKEISIRKVLGASFKAIFQLLTLNFLKLILVSFVIAIPIGWYMMQVWLDDFKYRTNLSWDVFVFAGIMVLIIAVLTVSFECIKAAVANPANGLRSE